MSADIDMRLPALQQQVATLRRENEQLQKDLAQCRQVADVPWEADGTFREFLLHSTDGVTLIDEGGILYEWSPGQEHITGWKRSEVVGRPIWDVQFQLLPEEERTPEAQSYLRAVAARVLTADQTSPTQQYERTIQRPDGVLRTIEARVFPVRIRNHRWLVSLVRDVSDRKQMEEVLHRSLLNLEVQQKIARAILTNRSAQQIAGAVVGYVRELAGNCRRASLIQCDLGSDEAVWLAVSGEAPMYLRPGMRRPLDFFGDVTSFRRDRDFIRVDEICELVDPAPIDRQLVAEGMHSYLVVPLVHQGNLIGFLNAVSATPAAFSQEHVEVLRQVTDFLAVALQNSRLLEQVQSDHRRLRALSRRLVEIQEAERHHIARELHDEIGQTLTAVKINLQSLASAQLAAGTAGQQLADSIKITEQALQQVRSLSLDLRPSLLDDLGLVATLRWYVDRQSQRGDFKARFYSNLADVRLPLESENTCFRIVQEALTNILRHAQAQQVSVELRQHDGSLTIAIQDDGIGFDPKTVMENAGVEEHMGLLGMQERVLLIDGEITIDSAPGAGTEIYVRFPWVAPSSSACSDAV